MTVSFFILAAVLLAVAGALRSAHVGSSATATMVWLGVVIALASALVVWPPSAYDVAGALLLSGAIVAWLGRVLTRTAPQPLANDVLSIMS